ncbi:MAG TPA: hypothetical protein VM242_15805 [Acidimicrobiales bacterium]|nr:hypothetical protein [Acidimicrobiales bacterium]
MPGRVAEDVVRQVLVRVDLHGVSVVGLDGDRQMMRWEWIESITAGEGVTVAGGGRTVAVPGGAFGLAADELAERLRAAGSIVHRTDVIADLQEAVDQA